jgi:hypothetical protein
MDALVELLGNLIYHVLHLQYLQIRRTFVAAGPPDPNKSVFVRHSSTVVCTAGIPHSLAIEPRDEFNNLCSFRPDENPTDGYDVAITQVTVY